MITAVIMGTGDSFLGLGIIEERYIPAEKVKVRKVISG